MALNVTSFERNVCSCPNVTQSLHTYREYLENGAGVNSPFTFIEVIVALLCLQMAVVVVDIPLRWVEVGLQQSTWFRARLRSQGEITSNSLVQVQPLLFIPFSFLFSLFSLSPSSDVRFPLQRIQLR